MRNIAAVFSGLYVYWNKTGRERSDSGLHSPEYQFDDTVLAGAAAAFANIAIHGCMGELKEN